MNTKDSAVAWAIATLSSLNYLILANQKIIQTPYSIIHQISTDQGDYYLKETPASTTFSLESRITQFLKNTCHAPVVNIIATNENRHCFLMENAGQSLRSYLKIHFQANLLFQAIQQYTKIQRATSEHLKSFLALGVCDWRTQLPELYHQLIQDKVILQNEGLRHNEIQSLEKLHPKIQTALEALSTCLIPATLVQSDFHTNNILIDPETQKLTFIDLGEVIITHPFFSLHGFLNQATVHHNIKSSDPIYVKMKKIALENWPNADGQKAFLITEKLYPLYSALVFYRFINSLGNALYLELNKTRPNRLAGFLRNLISNFAE